MWGLERFERSREKKPSNGGVERRRWKEQKEKARK